MNVAVRVKICCIANEAEAQLAIAHGAAAIGLVSAMPSGPGVIDDAMVARVAAAVHGQPVRSFLLTARTRAEAIATVQPHGLDLCTGVHLNGRLHAPTLAAFMAAVSA